MILLLDRGNTRSKWRVVNEAQVVASGADDDDSLPNLSVKLGSLSDGVSGKGVDIHRVLMANVAGDEVECSLISALGYICANVDVVSVKTLLEFNHFSTAYKNVSTMGVDRWLQMLAVHGRGLFPALIVSMGTAVTVDVLDEHGKHNGGLIAPGWGMLSTVVQRSTALINTVLPDTPNHRGLGDSTEACLHKGCSHMQLSFIERVDRHFGAGCKVKIVSGGDAASVVKELEGFRVVESLVLDGLMIIAENIDAYFKSLNASQKA